MGFLVFIRDNLGKKHLGGYGLGALFATSFR
jgi:hypothetical protein